MERKELIIKERFFKILVLFEFTDVTSRYIQNMGILLML